MLTSDYTQEKFLLMEISTSSGMEAVINKLLLSDDKNTNKILQKSKEKKKILADLTSSRLQLYDLYSAVSFLGVDMAYVVDCVRSRVQILECI